LQKVLAEQISKSFSEYVSAVHSDAEKLIEKTNADGMERTQEPELSEDMMAFAMGAVPKCFCSVPSPIANDGGTLPE
jgi:hypothetical protein